MRHHVKCCAGRSNRYRDIAILGFFQDGGLRHLVFLHFKSVKVRMVKKCRTASPCQISSKSLKPPPRYGDFRIFEISAAAILDY